MACLGLKINWNIVFYLLLILRQRFLLMHDLGFNMLNISLRLLENKLFNLNCIVRARYLSWSLGIFFISLFNPICICLYTIIHFRALCCKPLCFACNRHLGHINWVNYTVIIHWCVSLCFWDSFIHFNFYQTVLCQVFLALNLLILRVINVLFVFLTLKFNWIL